ncbi:GFA family protein [Paracoccus sp. (in: a-proteobacteria)]|uniref:GFA family protein n=1 Tax=Paracoccus sp. TaxID=267 RepID=UPI0026DFA290|nr:GFA family protein [Paracoccus sp. (in: a-proteobacteria)]MDO5647144.1 GFA family protein [Paracoccus sp. (in: a-proteobacteria)]
MTCNAPSDLVASDPAAPITGACHCGAVTFRVRLRDGLNSARRCTCSLCRMRGAVVVSARLADIQILTGQDHLTLYQFNTGVARHYFCKTCGVYTHHQRRSNPEEYGINLACLDGQTPFLEQVDVMDGVNHPRDTGTSRRAGVLRFTPD